MKRSLYLEEGKDCIIIDANISRMEFEKISDDSTVESVLIDFQNKYEALYHDFVFTDEIYENCNELELSIYIAIVILGLFAMLIVVVVIGIIVTIRYKKKYIELVEIEPQPTGNQY